MKEIKLTQNKVAIVDDEDYERLNQFKWHSCLSRNTCYAGRGIKIDSKNNKIYMHREIMNPPNGTQIDHRNGNGLDNRKSNMRACTSQQNGFNTKRAQKNNSLGIKGVSLVKKINKFEARIMFNSKIIRLGYFNVMGDADSAYRIAEEKYFGEFARNI